MDMNNITCYQITSYQLRISSYSIVDFREGKVRGWLLIFGFVIELTIRKLNIT